MATSSTDVLILIPLIPVAPLVITWWLPWERWIPWDKLPKFALGPYILYVAFAAWHFKLPWWTVTIFLLIGTTVSIMAIHDKVTKNNTHDPDFPTTPVHPENKLD